MTLIRWIVALAMVIAAGPATAQTAPFALDVVAEGFDQPLFVAAPPGDPRLFVVEQTGRIRILENGAVREQPFLDISGEVSGGNERGLLGIAFHPGYAENGRFFINYTDGRGDTRVAEYTVSADPNVAEAAPVKELLFVDQPQSNHNGGWIGFGPDGLLYVGMGDGGGAGDTQNRAQDDAQLLGKMLRLDVDAGGEPEVFLKGVRNPWRNAWDGETLYIADVGQNVWEEVHVVALADAGANLGWNVMEAGDCFRPRENCDQGGLTLPVAQYNHDEGCSITGGYVYRGAAVPAIEGLYFYGDYCSGTLWSFRLAGGVATDLTSYFDTFGAIGPITSFGLDGAGEMYLITQDGIVRKFVPAS
jgi:glucose/arabinose dehydrogenase